MRSILRNMAVLAGALALAGCVGGGSGGGKAKAPNPITGGEIEVTALDAPPAAKPAAPPAAGAPPVTDPMPPPEKPAPAATEDLPPPEAAASVPEARKSPAQLACERKGDLWVKAGTSSLFTCVTRTGDAGRRCTSGRQCQGECLARSGTCAPYQPLFGCNDILQDNGVRMTLCLD